MNFTHDAQFPRFGEQNTVLRNTYLLLGLSMLPTVLGAWIGSSMSFGFAAAHPGLYALGAMGVLFGLFFAISANRNNGAGLALLLGLTFILGIMLGPILQHTLGFGNGSAIVGMTALGTGAAFLTLAGVAMTVKKDFSFMGKYLLVGLVMLVLASLANLFFLVPALDLAISALGVLLFAAFMLYDVSRIVNGGETNFVMATLSLYLDIYNMFTSMLQLAAAFTGDSD